MFISFERQPTSILYCISRPNRLAVALNNELCVLAQLSHTQSWATRHVDRITGSLNTSEMFAIDHCEHHHSVVISRDVSDQTM